jgi:cell division protein FtsL
MGRVLIGFFVAAIIAGIIFFLMSQNYKAQSEQQAHQIDELNQQISKLQSQNDDLKNALAKVQSEQTVLAAQNDELRKAIATYKATGKMPELVPANPPK